MRSKNHLHVPTLPQVPAIGLLVGGVSLNMLLTTLNFGSLVFYYGIYELFMKTYDAPLMVPIRVFWCRISHFEHCPHETSRNLHMVTRSVILPNLNPALGGRAIISTSKITRCRPGFFTFHEWPCRRHCVVSG